MQEYTIEEKFIIDQQIKKLDEEQTIYFKTYYKKPKNEYALIALILIFGLFGAPFFYIKNKYITPDMIILAVLNFILMVFIYMIYILTAVIGFSLIFRFFIFAISVGGYYLIYYRNYEKFKRAIDFYNYNEKAKILREIIK